MEAAAEGQSSTRRQRQHGWLLWLEWVAGNVAPLLAGWLVMASIGWLVIGDMGTPARYAIGMLLLPVDIILLLLVALGVAIAQWLILKPRVGTAWAGFTFAGLLLGTGVDLSLVLYQFDHLITTDDVAGRQMLVIACGMLFGSLLGLAQFVEFRAPLRRALLWWVATTAAGALGAVTAIIASANGLALLVSLGVYFLVFNMATGAVLLWMDRSSRATNFTQGTSLIDRLTGTRSD